MSTANYHRFKIPLLIFILLAVFLAFLPCLNNQFLFWDDEEFVWNNSDVRSFNSSHLKNIFAGTVVSTYVPLTVLSFAAEHRWAGNQVWVYHLDNVLLHLGVVALIFILGSRLGLSVSAAGLAALFFGIHPMHVEAVAWVAARKDVLYSFFYLLSLLSYTTYLKGKCVRHLAGSLLLGLLSLLAKPMALSLPLVLLILDWWYARPFKKDVWLEKLPFVFLMAPVVWMTYSLHARIPAENVSTAILTWIWTFSFYLKKFFFPLEFLPKYDLPQPVSLVNPEYILAVVIFLVLLWFIFIGRRHRWFILGCLYYFASIFFLLRFDDKVDVTFVADRFMYLPSLGFSFFVGYVFDRILWTEHKVWLHRAVLVCMILMFVLLGMQTFRQCRIWKNDISLWRYAFEKYPTADIAYVNMGDYYLQRKDFSKAIYCYQRSLTFNPAYFPARARLFSLQKDFDKALADYDRILAINPRDKEALKKKRELHELLQRM